MKRPPQPSSEGGPTFEAARAHEVVELVHVLDREEEVYAAATARHRQRHLREHQAQAPGAQRRHRRLGLGRVRLKLEPEAQTVEVERLFEAVDFEEQQLNPADAHKLQTALSRR